MDTAVGEQSTLWAVDTSVLSIKLEIKSNFNERYLSAGEVKTYIGDVLWCGLEGQPSHVYGVARAAAAAAAAARAEPPAPATVSAAACKQALTIHEFCNGSNLKYDNYFCL